MASAIRIIIQFLIVFLPLMGISVLFYGYDAFTKLEVGLISALSAGAPWLLYELLSRSDHQQKANKALVQFCTSLEKMFSSMSVIEKQSEEQPKELMAELKMLQGILHQLSLEKTQGVQQAHAGMSTGTQSTYSAMAETPPSTPQDLSSPPEPIDIPKAEVIDLKSKGTVQEDDEPDDDSGIIETNKSLTRDQLLTVIETALSDDHIEMLVQPIVSLPQRKPRHFECYSRIKTPDGNMFTPDHFVHLAEEENLIRLLDNAMLFRCIQMARASVKKKFDVNFFCNVSQHTLSDKFFFDSLIEFFQSNRELGRNIILEFHEKAIVEKLDELEPLFRKLKLYNCRFSIDQVTTFHLDIKRLKTLNFKFIKFHSDALVHKTQEDKGIEDLKAFKKLCNAHNMDIIASHIEDEKSLIELNEFHFDYGQGYLFGSPVLSKSK